jgi:hypothetical protein
MNWQKRLAKLRKYKPDSEKPQSREAWLKNYNFVTSPSASCNQCREAGAKTINGKEELCCLKMIDEAVLSDISEAVVPNPPGICDFFISLASGLYLNCGVDFTEDGDMIITPMRPEKYKLYRV